MIIIGKKNSPQTTSLNELFKIQKNKREKKKIPKMHWHNQQKQSECKYRDETKNNI